MAGPRTSILWLCFASALSGCHPRASAPATANDPAPEPAAEASPASAEAPDTTPPATTPPERTVGEAARLARTPKTHSWPDPEAAVLTAPAEFTVLVETTKGPFTLAVHRDWGPHAADRFYNLVALGYFTDIAFFRAIAGFMVQFGLHGDPKVNTAWEDHTILDDPVVHTNAIGTMAFAKTAAPNSATTQLFINLGDNRNLDGMGFTPFAEVRDGMDVVSNLYTGLGEGAPRGRGPSQDRLSQEGNAYLEQFPQLDRIESMTLVPTDGAHERPSVAPRTLY